ncbi:MAG: large repetitive protein, partial [Bacteroidota bacterium]|nr:large repetitive protein [Bacteroidota bacterium]
IRVTPLDSATHQPITGTEISLYKDNQLLNTYTYQQTPIYFTSLCPGTYYVHLSKSGYNGYGFSVTLTCNDTSIFYKSMLGTPHDTCCHGKIVVTVRNSTNGDLIDSVRVQISQNGNVLSYANTLHGVVSFTGLCPGTYNMYYMTKTGWTRTDSPTWDVTLSCNDSAGYVKHLVNNNHCCHGQITVNVLDSLTNNGIDSCYVGLSQNGSVIMTSYTSSGVSVFNGLCPGTYSLYYGKSGWYRPGIISWNVTINCNDTVSFTRKMIENSQCCSGSISGIVTDTATNAPIANARIVLYLNNTNMGTVYADSTGAFQFTGLCPGSYSLTLTANQYNSKGIHSISLGCSDVSNQLDIQMLHL